jgi:hypothetical protein
MGGIEPPSNNGSYSFIHTRSKLLLTNFVRNSSPAPLFYCKLSLLPRSKELRDIIRPGILSI